MITLLERQALQYKERHIDIGISISRGNLGDQLQFSSLPENFYKRTGHKLIDVSKAWFFDYNPYVIRDHKPRKMIEMWNYPKQYEWSKIRNSVYLSNAEIHLSVLNVSYPVLIRPRLYRFEDDLFEARYKILFHPFGRSHGALPDHVIDHVITKYKSTGDLWQIGIPSDPDLGIPRCHTPTLWDLAQEISACRMFIGVDSGPSWIAACYPDVQIKKIRTKFQGGFSEPKDWVPLDINNPHSHWDDQGLFQIYNTFEEDCGFTHSYRRL